MVKSRGGLTFFGQYTSFINSWKGGFALLLSYGDKVGTLQTFAYVNLELLCIKATVLMKNMFTLM